LNSSLCEELSYWEIEAKSGFDYVILNDGSISAGFEITPIDIECFDNDRLNQLSLGLRSVLNSVNDEYSIQLHVRVDSDFTDILNRHRELRCSANEFICKLDKGRIDLIEQDIESNGLNRMRVFAYLKTPQVKKTSLFSWRTAKKFAKEYEQNHSARVDELAEGLSGFKSSLSNLGFGTKALVKNDLVQNIYRYLNPLRAQSILPPEIFSPNDVQLPEGILQSEPELAIQSPRSQLTFGDLILDRDEFILDQLKTRVLSLKNLPETTVAGQMDSFLRFPFHYDLIFTLKVSDQVRELKRLERNRRMAHSLSQTKSGQVADLESEAKLSTTENLIRELIETGQHIFIAELLVVLREENSKDGLKRLNQKTRDVLSRFKTLSGAEGAWETVGAWKIFKSSLPAAPVNLERGRPMKTNNLVDFLPLYGSRLGAEKPVVLIHNRLGSLVSHDPYDSGIGNFNSLVTGSSGSGKSFFNNYLLLQQIARGTKVFIIDIGGSYQKLTSLLDGQYFEMNLSDEYAINPFEISDVRAGPTNEKVKALTSIIEQMVSEDSFKLSKFERVLIEKAVVETYARLRPEGQTPILSDFEATCRQSIEPELLRIAKLLYSWVGNSAFGKLLDRPGGLKTDSSIIAFDLKGLSQYPDLQSVMILILTNFILDQVENDKTVSKKVILDEAWQLLKSEAASGFMEYAARTFRKTGSAITFITQGIDEIAASSIGSAIINNTAIKVILSQRGDTNLLRDTLKLNSKELSLIQGLEQRMGVYSEAFLIEGDHRQVIRIYPGPLEYWISTSNKDDNNYLNSLRDSGLDLAQAVQKAAEVYPFGVIATKSEMAV
jgi:conjugal transfer ATP-binding protein TraC